MVGDLHNRLPDPGESAICTITSDDEGPKCWELRVTVGNSEPIKHKLHKGIVYFGTHDLILREELDTESEFERNEQLRTCLRTGNKKDSTLWSSINEWRPKSEEFQQFIPKAILEKDEPVKIELYNYVTNQAGLETDYKLVGTVAKIAGMKKAIEYKQFRKDRFNNICMYSN